MQKKLLGLKGFLLVVIGVILYFMCFTRLTVNAAELTVETLSDSTEVVQLMQDNMIKTVVSSEERERSVFFNDSKERIPNYFTVEAVVEGSSGSDTIKLIAHNIGVDKIDKISCNVKITDIRGVLQYHKVVTFSDVTPLFSPTHNIYVKDWKKIEITNIQAWDGTDYATRSDHTIIRE